MIYTSVCRAIRNMVRDDPDKGIKPVLRVEKCITSNKPRIFSLKIRIDRNRTGTFESWGNIWYYFIYPLEETILEDDIVESLEEFWCEYCKKQIECKFFEEHLSEFHDMNLENYMKLFGKCIELSKT